MFSLLNIIAFDKVLQQHTRFVAVTQRINTYFCLLLSHQASQKLKQIAASLFELKLKIEGEMTQQKRTIHVKCWQYLSKTQKSS